jgi:hypothetical protein
LLTSHFSFVNAFFYFSIYLFWSPAEAAKAASQLLPYSGIYLGYNVLPYFIHTADAVLLFVGAFSMGSIQMKSEK